MKFNSNVFFLARPPHLIMWNCETHEQFELSPTYQVRLLELIGSPQCFDKNNPVDMDFASSGVLCQNQAAEKDWGWDVLSRLFHMGTKNIPLQDPPIDSSRWAIQYADHCRETLTKQYPAENYKNKATSRIALPKPLALPGVCLTHGLISRKTARNYHRDPVKLATVATVLYYSLAYLPERLDEESMALPVDFRHRRSSPSSGGLNSAEGYLYAYNVESIPPAIYYYNPKDHSLEFKSFLDGLMLGALLNGQHFINELPFGVFLTSRLDKLWWKYEHSRAYRMALIEVGHIAQTIQLVTTSIGMQTWLTGALNEEAIEKLIKPTLGTEEVMFFVGGGFGDGKATPVELASELERQAIGRRTQ